MKSDLSYRAKLAYALLVWPAKIQNYEVDLLASERSELRHKSSRKLVFYHCEILPSNAGTFRLVITNL